MMNDADVSLTPAERHALKVEERNQAKKRRERQQKALQKSWERIKSEKAVKELLKFILVEIERHRRVGADGVGYDMNQNIIRFTNEQRISSMDRAAGLEEISEYMKRHMQ